MKPINIMLGPDWRQDRALAQRWWDTFERLQLILRRAAAAGLAPEVCLMLMFVSHFCPEPPYPQYVACSP